MPKIMQRPHVPTTLVILGAVLLLFVLYHLALGRRRSQ